MNDSCALQYYYFQLGERNKIIEYFKNFLRSLKYLKNKPSVGHIFDISLQNSLKEFQQQKQLKITGFFNDETYAAIGAEMGEKRIQLMRKIEFEFSDSVLWWLLNGKKGIEPKFRLQQGSSINSESSNGNPADEQADKDLAELLTDFKTENLAFDGQKVISRGGIVKAASVSNQGGRQLHFRLSDGKVYTIHIYGDRTGTAVTGIYLPKFFSKPIYEGKDTVIATIRTGEVLGIAHIRISSQAELDKNYSKNILNSKGSRYIGEIGGTGGDGGCYRHSHLHFFPSAKSRNFVKNYKNSGSDPTAMISTHLLDVRELLRR